MLLCTACEVTVTETTPEEPEQGKTITPVEEDEYVVGTVQATRGLPTDYLISDVSAFSYDDALYRGYVYTSVCEEKDLRLNWQPDAVQEGTVDFYYVTERDSVNLVLNDMFKVPTYYTADPVLAFPAGMYYQTEMEDKTGITGTIIDDTRYMGALYINTECPLEDLDLADEVFNFFKIEDDGMSSAWNCKSVSIDYMNITLDSIKPQSLNFIIGYMNNICKVDLNLRYAYYEDDCNAAYDEFLDDVAEAEGYGEAVPEFKMDNYNYEITAPNLDCLDGLVDEFMGKTGGDKKKAIKGVKKILGKIANSLRKK